ncbi:hypothetical protein P5P93_00060 [Klebsiella pneumoniae]|nr:hypothetical protein P5P93_00060 [Klebsiella pneumoniae]
MDKMSLKCHDDADIALPWMDIFQWIKRTDKIMFRKNGEQDNTMAATME